MSAYATQRVMELPDDVLAIVRQYSKPCFTHFKAYNEALRLLNMSEWPLLKEHLSMPSAEKVVSVLHEYLAAFVAKKEAYTAFEHYNSSLFADIRAQSMEQKIEFYRLKSIASNAQNHLEFMYRYLMIRTLGAELVYRDELVYQQNKIETL